MFPITALSHRERRRQTGRFFVARSSFLQRAVSRYTGLLRPAVPVFEDQQSLLRLKGPVVPEETLRGTSLSPKRGKELEPPRRTCCRTFAVGDCVSDDCLDDTLVGVSTDADTPLPVGDPMVLEKSQQPGVTWVSRARPCTGIPCRGLRIRVHVLVKLARNLVALLRTDRKWKTHSPSVRQLPQAQIRRRCETPVLGCLGCLWILASLRIPLLHGLRPRIRVVCSLSTVALALAAGDSRAGAPPPHP